MLLSSAHRRREVKAGDWSVSLRRVKFRCWFSRAGSLRRIVGAESVSRSMRGSPANISWADQQGDGSVGTGKGEVLTPIDFGAEKDQTVLVPVGHISVPEGWERSQWARVRVMSQSMVNSYKLIP